MRAIQEATNRAVPADSDMMPVAASGSSTAYKIKLEDLIASIPRASTTRRGLVELATDVEVQAGTDGTRAVTPASLAVSVGAKHLIPGCFSIGRINATTLTYDLLNRQFLIIMGRVGKQGDLVAVEDKNDYLYILAYGKAEGAVKKEGWYGMLLTGAGSWKSYTDV